MYRTRSCGGTNEIQHGIPPIPAYWRRQGYSELSAYINYEKQYIPKFAAASVLPAAKTMLPVPDDQVLTMGNDENGKPYLVQPDAWK